MIVSGASTDLTPYLFLYAMILTLPDRGSTVQVLVLQG
jgi:hypothetical protein